MRSRARVGSPCRDPWDCQSHDSAASSGRLHLILRFSDAHDSTVVRQFDFERRPIKPLMQLALHEQAATSVGSSIEVGSLVPSSTTERESRGSSIAGSQRSHRQSIGRRIATTNSDRSVLVTTFVELQRIALGDDSTATARDRLTADDRLSDIESRRESVTHVTMNIFRDVDGNPLCLDGQPEDAESNENSESTSVSA